MNKELIIFILYGISLTFTALFFVEKLGYGLNYFIAALCVLITNVLARFVFK